VVRTSACGRVDAGGESCPRDMSVYAESCVPPRGFGMPPAAAGVGSRSNICAATPKSKNKSTPSMVFILENYTCTSTCHVSFECSSALQCNSHTS
jgi:hypothetical protein